MEGRHTCLMSKLKWISTVTNRIPRTVNGLHVPKQIKVYLKTDYVLY